MSFMPMDRDAIIAKLNEHRAELQQLETMAATRNDASGSRRDGAQAL